MVERWHPWKIQRRGKLETKGRIDINSLLARLFYSVYLAMQMVWRFKGQKLWHDTSAYGFDKSKCSSLCHHRCPSYWMHWLQVFAIINILQEEENWIWIILILLRNYFFSVWYESLLHSFQAISLARRLEVNTNQRQCIYSSFWDERTLVDQHNNYLGKTPFNYAWDYNVDGLIAMIVGFCNHMEYNNM